MAELEDRYEDNVKGRYFVDEQCIDCDLCRETASANFKRNEDWGYSYVYKQPENEEEENQESPDSDNDGISDEDDACPDENASDHDADADGCIDDSDNDGVKNDVDPCPFDSADGCLGNLEGNNETFIEGCTYESAKNYNPDATDDDGSCQYGVADSPGFGIFAVILSCLIIGFRRKY